MTGETLQEIYRRLGLPEIPQELIDKAREQIRAHERRMADPQLKAEIDAHSKAMLARFRKSV